MAKVRERAIPRAPLVKKLRYFIWTALTMRSLEKAVNEALKRRDVNDKS